MDNKLTKQDCIDILVDKFHEAGRFPKKSDFTEQQVAGIKSFLGPWPRALEQAGIKEPRPEDKFKKIEERKIRSKIRKREYKLESRKKLNTDNK